MRVVIKRDDLLKAVGPDDNYITLTLTADGTLTAVDSDPRGEMSVTQQMPVVKVLRGDGLPFTVRMQAKNLRGALKGIASGVLHFDALTPVKPVVLRGLSGDELHMIMPVRMPAPAAADTAA